MKKRYIIVPTILVAVVVIAGGFKPSATSTPQTKIVSIATPTEKNQVSVSAEEKMAETKQALKEIEATSSEIDSRLLQSTAELKVQERLLQEIEQIESDFESGRISADQYLERRHELNRQIRG